MSWLLHWVIVAASIALTANVVNGIKVNGFGPAMIAAVVLGVLNIFLKPILILLTLPLTVLTFGLFLLVVNAIVISLCGAFVPGFEVKGFWAALVGAVLISVFSWIGDAVASKIFGSREVATQST